MTEDDDESMLPEQREDVRRQAVSLVDMLVNGQYAALQRVPGSRFDADLVRKVVDSHPATFVSNPLLSASSMIITPTHDECYLLDIQMCKETGLSDLTLRCVVEPQVGKMAIIPWDILMPRSDALFPLSRTCRVAS